MTLLFVLIAISNINNYIFDMMDSNKNINNIFNSAGSNKENEMFESSWDSFFTKQLMPIKARAAQIMSKIPLNFYSFDEIEDTPYKDLNYTEFQKAKYWSVIENFKDTNYSVRKVVSSQYLDTYYIKTPHGEEIYNGYYKNSGRYNFTPKKRSYIHADEIMCFLSDEFNYKIKFNYIPEEGEFEKAHEIINNICDEKRICISNIFKENFTIIYCLKSSISYIVLKIMHNENYRITTIAPFSTSGENDEYLSIFTNALCEIRKEESLSLF